MERLTRKSSSTDMVWFVDHDNNNMDLEPCEMSYTHNRLAIQKLSYYEDLEEQGRLLIIPCKVGDTLYRIVDRGFLKDACETDCYSCEIECPYDGRKYERVIEIVPWEMTSMVAIIYAMEQFGKTVFFSYEEAEEVLRNI